MKDRAAIDFETANNKRTSVCSVGIVIYQIDFPTDLSTALWLRPKKCGLQESTHWMSLLSTVAMY